MGKDAESTGHREPMPEFDRERILALSERYDSFYLYDEGSMLHRGNRLMESFPGVEFLYSIKANSLENIAAAAFRMGMGADAASIGEVRLARRLGLDGREIFYSAPGKGSRDLEEALGHAVVTADSLSEVRRIQEIVERRGTPAEIGIRINPDFTFFAEQGEPSKFGVDEETFLEEAKWIGGLSHVTVTGIHVHLRSQELRADTLARYYEKIFAMADRVETVLGRPLGFLNLGSGLGIPYGEEDGELDLAYLGRKTGEMLSNFRAERPQTRIFIETGRYLVGKCGVYVTKVVDVKVSRGRKFVLLHNTLNGFLRPCLEQLILQYADGAGAFAPGSGSRELTGTEPLFTRRGAFHFETLSGRPKEERPMETVTLAGNLCTSADVMAKDIRLPELRPGDVVAVTNAGGYGAVLSPMQFSSQTPPAQLFLTAGGEIRPAAVPEAGVRDTSGVDGENVGF